MENQDIEIWKEVTKLYSMKSSWELDLLYHFPLYTYYVSNKGNFYIKGKGVVSLKPSNSGYIVVSLRGKRFKLHQIVMQTFHPEGISDYITPDHIDKNQKTNNCLTNIRWANRKTQCSNRENVEYKNKKVKCEQNNIIYDSCKEAEISLNLTKNTVSRVARGERKSIRGYNFVYI